MLKESQENYLASLPEGRVIDIKPFDPRAQELGKEILTELQVALPDARIQFGGAAALGIAGQNDIDILILSSTPMHEQYRTIIEGLYGAPSRIGLSKSVKWEFVRDGFDVEIYMADEHSAAAKEQMRIFELLSSSEELRKAYEQVKLPYGPIDFKEYMRKKYAFFNNLQL